jgi:hypothetical protein
MMHIIFRDFDFVFRQSGPTTVYKDKSGCTPTMTYKDNLTGNSRHIDTLRHYVRELVFYAELSSSYANSVEYRLSNQKLAGARFVCHRSVLMGHSVFHARILT